MCILLSMLKFIAQVEWWGVLPTGMSDGAPPLGLGGDDMAPLLQGTDGGDQAFWQERRLHARGFYLYMLSL